MVNVVVTGWTELDRLDWAVAGAGGAISLFLVASGLLLLSISLYSLRFRPDWLFVLSSHEEFERFLQVVLVMSLVLAASMVGGLWAQALMEIEVKK